MIIAAGEILFDVFPEYRRLGGAPFNFIYHVMNMGVPARFFTRVGRDDEGREVVRRLKGWGFNIDDVQIDETHRTGIVNVKLDRSGVPEFEILKNSAYDFLSFNDRLNSALEENVDLIYFGTLLQRTEQGFLNLQKILSNKSPRTKCMYDINLRPECYSRDAVIESLKGCDILKINDDELGIVKKYFNSRESDYGFIGFLMSEFSIEMTALTKGAEGSELFKDGGHYISGPAEVDRIEDTVGAGDAYAAVLAAGYIKGWGPDMIVESAARFAAEICRIKGAIPEDKKFYKEYLEKLK